MFRCAAVHQDMKEIHTPAVPRIHVIHLPAEKMEFVREMVRFFFTKFDNFDKHLFLKDNMRQ